MIAIGIGVVLPADDFPRIFVKLPINETNFLPFNVVLDGSFDPKQEREVIAMTPNDCDLISTAMEAFPTLIQYAVKSQWRDAHKLAHLAIPKRTLSGESEELEWWKNIIFKIAKATAAKPIIDTEEGLLPALQDDGKNVTFLVPATDSERQNSIDYDTIHQLASQVIGLYLPDKALAQDWSEIAPSMEEDGVANCANGSHRVDRLGPRKRVRILQTCPLAETRSSGLPICSF